MTATLTALAVALCSSGLEREPTIDDVVAGITAAQAGESGDLERTTARSRWASALPERLTVRVRGDDTSTFDDGSTDDGWSKKRRDGQRIGWQVDVTWDLSRLAFDPRASRLVELESASARRLADLVDWATRSYFQRRRLQLQFLRTPPGEEARRSALWVDIAELTARLDVRCGRCFSSRRVEWWNP